MTPEELRKLDGEVHRKVMGKRAEWIASEPCEVKADPTSPLGFVTNFGGQVFTADREWLSDDWLDPDENREVPFYSTDIAAAWRVVEKFRPYVKVDARGCHGEGPWVCSLWVGGPEIQGSGDTAPLAICRAALVAVGGEGET